MDKSQNTSLQTQLTKITMALSAYKNLANDEPSAFIDDDKLVCICGGIDRTINLKCLNAYNRLGALIQDIQSITPISLAS